MSRYQYETFEEYRRRILRDTERFIEWGLRNPDKVIEIPAKRIDKQAFPSEVGRWFWNVVLATRTDSTIVRFREMLLAKPRDLWRRLSR